MVTLHEVITFLVSMQISIAACRPIMSIDVVEVVIWRESSVSGGSGARSEERFSRNAETDIVCRLLLEKKKKMLTAYWKSTRLNSTHVNSSYAACCLKTTT